MKKLTFVLGLFVLCIFSASSLTAQIKAQTGVFNADRNISNYMLAAGGEMERVLQLNITFPKPFKEKPEVMLSVTRFDGERSVNTRYDIKVTSVYKTGFSMEIKTWGGSKIYLIGGTWLAIGEL